MRDFQLPIAYLADRVETDSHVVADLGSVGESSLYRLVAPPSGLGHRTIDQWGHHFTANVRFLKDSQRLLTKALPLGPSPTKGDEEGITELWDDISAFDALDDNGAAFVAQYQYMEWERLYALNRHGKFLLWMSIYNMSSPLLSLVLPILLLFVPFIVLQAQGERINFGRYCEVLRVTFSKHQLGQLFLMDSSASMERKGYVAVSAGLYVLQMYQNARACWQFWANIGAIKKKIAVARRHIEASVSCMDKFNRCCSGLKSYTLFMANNMEHCTNLKRILRDLRGVSLEPFQISEAMSIGHMMKCFYLLYRDRSYKGSIEYSMDFCGYLQNLQAFKRSIGDAKLGKATFTKKKTRFTDAYYPSAENPVTNSYGLGKHMLLTGPNAAGKTTLLKTTLFNILLTQQLGYGCYKTAKLAPFDRIHCYINIPDTSGRDSLFQAEARRCKDILTALTTGPADTRHFCVFDELYSGTNPYEAIGSAAAFLEHLAARGSASFMITTHFLGLCRRLDAHPGISNHHMHTKAKDGDMQYTYKLKRGVSTIKGGVKVLRDLGYPSSIVERTKEIIEETQL